MWVYPLISKKDWIEHPIVLGLWFLKPANFNRCHIGRTHRGRSVVLFGCSKRKGKGERDRESGSSHEESPGEASPVKRHYQGHFTRLYFEISQ